MFKYLFIGVNQSSKPFNSSVVDAIGLSPGEKQKIELSVLPDSSVKNFRITAIAVNIVDDRDHEISGRLPFNIRGKRLSRNPKEVSSSNRGI